MNIYSLGYNCEIEMNLEKFSRRNNKGKRISTPFNWTISNLALPILRLLETDVPLFEECEVITPHCGQVIRNMPRCCTTGLISYHDIEPQTLKSPITEAQRVLLISKYKHTSEHLRELLFKQKGNVFLRRINNEPNLQCSLTQMIEEKDEVLQFLTHYGHKGYFISDERLLCNEKDIFFIDKTKRVYQEYKRLLKRFE